MIKSLIKLSFIAASIAAVVYLVPPDIKDKTLAGIANVVSTITPQVVKDKVEPIIYTPTERRAQIISQLEKNISDIKKDLLGTTQPENTQEGPSTQPPTPTPNNTPPLTNPNTTPTQRDPIRDAIVQKLQEAQALLEELDQSNEEQGIVNKVTSGIFKKIKNTTSEENRPSSPPAPNCSWSCPAE